MTNYWFSPYNEYKFIMENLDNGAVIKIDIFNNVGINMSTLYIHDMVRYNDNRMTDTERLLDFIYSFIFDDFGFIHLDYDVCVTPKLEKIKINLDRLDLDVVMDDKEEDPYPIYFDYENYDLRDMKFSISTNDITILQFPVSCSELISLYESIKSVAIPFI